MREKIIISDIDLKILKFLSNEKIVKEVMIEFKFWFSDVVRHTNRLKKLGLIECIAYGNFRKLKINSHGINLLKILKWE